jgi:O-antigen/teichoic acid export membrane protein
MEQRNLIYLKNTIFNYGFTGLIYFFSFLSVPLMLSYLNNVQFGIYQTVLTTLTWASIGDLGIGNGLRNKISEYYATNEFIKLRKTEGSAFFIALIVSIVMITIGVVFFFVLFDPQWLFKTIITNKSDVVLTFFLSFLFLSLNFLFSLFSSICYGIQQSYIVSMSKFVNNMLFCVLLYFLIFFHVESITFYVSIIYGLALILSNIVPFFYIQRKKYIWPPIYDKRSNKKETKGLLNVSLNFLILQISTIVLFASDNFIVAKLLGAEDVTNYSIVSKLFMFIINVYSILLIQLWNATTEANAKKDYDWIRQSVRKLQLALLPVLAVSLFIAIFFSDISRIWLKREFHIDKIFLCLFALYTVIHCLNGIFVNVLNGLTRIKWQLYIYSATAVVNIVLSILFIRNFNMGINGMIYSKIICLSLTSIVCYIDYKIYAKQLIKVGK